MGFTRQREYRRPEVGKSSDLQGTCRAGPQEEQVWL